MTSATSDPKTLSSVERAADVLLTFCYGDEPDLGVSEIARRLAISKTAVYRILTSLSRKGLVQADPQSRRYRLGPAVMQLGAKYRQQLSLRALVSPALERIAAETRETVTLSVRNGWVRTYIEQIESPHDVKMQVALGETVPLYAGSTSKAFLAHLPDAELEEYLASSDLVPIAHGTITDPDDLRREIREVRSRGYAASFGERQQGAASVAAAILDHNGHVVGVISVGGPAERMRPAVREIGELLRHTVRSLSRQFGFDPDADPSPGKAASGAGART